MKRGGDLLLHHVFRGIFLASLAGSSFAQPVFSAGYAMDQPERLADQLTWGVAHAARLLGRACAEAGFGAAAEAWVDWQERQWPQIEAVRTTLSQHYFGIDHAAPLAIAAALGLKSTLDLPPEELVPACTTLATALAGSRYDLVRRRAEFLERHTRHSTAPPHD